jgi:folate-binding protein YgfZ
MGLTVLQSHGETLSPQAVGEYRGATMAVRYSDRYAEFAALRTGCGVYDLGYRAKISLTGSDRVRWLNGMVTNNVRDLQPGHGIYAFLLNPQGHILGDLYAYNRGDSVTVDTDLSQIAKILATFDHYIIMDDVEVKNLGDEVSTLGIAGPKARAVLAASGIQVPDMQPLQIADAKCTCDCECSSCPVVRGDDPIVENYELWLAPGDVKKTWDALIQHGATPVGSEALDLWRMVSGIPLYGVDIRDRDLPQETEQARALNFSKGCYVGQEIVERIRSRGAVHRKFCGFQADSSADIKVGMKVFFAEKEVGEITTVASLGTGQPLLALGYIRREIFAPGKQVAVGSAHAEIRELPFKEI